MAVLETRPLIKRWDKLSYAEAGEIAQKTKGMSGFVSKGYSAQFGSQFNGYEGGIFVAGGKVIPLEGTVVADFGDGVIFARQTPDITRDGEIIKGYEFQTAWDKGNVTSFRVEVASSEEPKALLGGTFAKIIEKIEK